METLKDLKQKSLIAIAESLGIPFKQISSDIYEHPEHDSFKVFMRTNTFKWFSRDQGGDAIDFVQTLTGVGFKEAVSYLKTGNFQLHKEELVKKEPFRYYVTEDGQEDFHLARHYLKEERGISDSTINFFGRQGIMAQALYRHEPVLVFKAFNHRHVLVGASLQGLNRHIGEKRPYLKRTMKHSEGHVGVSVDIGKPNRLVFTESVIDAMSYFELHQSSLENTRLVAMDGLKRSCIAYQLLRLIAEEKKNLSFLDSLNPSKLLTYLTTLIETTTYFKETPAVITLAVDHDKAGLDFIGKCSNLSVPFQVDLPHLPEEKGKSDWNDILKSQKSPSLESLINQARIQIGTKEKTTEPFTLEV